MATLAALVLYNSVSSRIGLRPAVDHQLADLARSAAELARQVAEINRRLGALEASVDSTVNRARAVTDPLALEIGELGRVVKQLAATVAAQQTALASLPLAGAPSGEPSAQTEGRPAAEEAAALPSPAPPLPSPAGGRMVGQERGDIVVAPVSSSEPTQSAPPPQVQPGMSGDMAALIRIALDTNRIDLYLQPIVTLPQRKVRYYEAMSRLHAEGGALLQGADFIPQAEYDGLMPQIDSLAIFRCVQVLRRLLLKNRDIGMFCNLSGTTLTGRSFPKLLEFMQANRAIASSLVLEFTQRAVRTMSAVEQEGLAALSDCGFRFSLDNVMDLRIEPRELASRGFRFIKVRSDLLLNRTSPPYPPALAGEAKGAGDIHPADLADLFARFGLDLIAEKIESEGSVVDLLDHDVRYGQGFLFSPPRPVRAEALQGIGNRSDGSRAGAGRGRQH